ncbi:toll/interleukin-1 receptor domain-containing protein [Actinophytocola sp.]|uniref:toll/interleukin-1 receptor domain-containing protein n=1 Tax=Actinophytocola sp. TaxID=1872138 RepID=UPI003899C9AE
MSRPDSTPSARTVEPPPRVFISYAHEDPAHIDQVWALWNLLRANGIDARLDLPAATRRQDWPLWMLEEVGAADFVLVVASPEYRRRGEGKPPAEQGLGVQWEAALIREEVYSDRASAVRKFLPVLLPGRSTADIPAWLGPNSGTSYRVDDFTLAGAEELIRVLTRQPLVKPAPLGRRPLLPSRQSWQEASQVAPFYRLFLHFFDPHFLDQVSRGRNADFIAREANRATRLAVLAAQTVFVPAASYIESDLCADTINEYRDLFDTGQIVLVGGEANIVDFATRKLLQYEPGGTRYERYESVLSSTRVTPPFRSRQSSATSDITMAWQRRLHDLSAITEGLPRDAVPASELERRWESVPEALAGRAFTPEYVARLLFDPMPTTGPELIVARRAGSEVNSAYFASYTSELDAGIITELTYLNSPRPGGRTALDLPFSTLLRQLDAHRVADLVFNARPERLPELRSHPDVIAAIVSATGQSPLREIPANRLSQPEPGW